MSDPKTVSEREAVDRVRSAVRHALYNGAGWGAAVADAYVNREHPRPKVERPRVVYDAVGDAWKYEHGKLWRRVYLLSVHAEKWEEWDEYTDSMQSLVDDLLAHPTETVDH